MTIITLVNDNATQIFQMWTNENANYLVVTNEAEEPQKTTYCHNCDAAVVYSLHYRSNAMLMTYSASGVSWQLHVTCITHWRQLLFVLTLPTYVQPLS